jgi:iron complex outermembrane receptor protein
MVDAEFASVLPNNLSNMNKLVKNLLIGSTLGLPFVLGAQSDDRLQELETFIARETALQAEDSLLPTVRQTNSVFGVNRDLIELPRAVTILTPEIMKQFGVQDFSDLQRVTAGAAAPNFYGVPGTPFMRGDFAGTFFNGMQRLYQRNEQPTSFGSLEAMDVVKGPAPANFGATQAGGYVNFIPKSPYFDMFRGSLQATVGSYDMYRIQMDIGGPQLIFDRPSAYRLSFTAQQADSYYNDVGNDFLSLYGAIKSQLSESLTLFTGAEFYKFRSNENAGWNRVTQDLVDNGNYIIGDVADQTSAAFFGFADRPSIPFIGAFGGESATIGSTAFDGIVGGGIIAPNPTPGLEGLLGPNGEYTAAYLNAGGQVATVRLRGNQVLSDPSDYANSESFLLFKDLVSTANPDRTLKNQVLVDVLRARKLSSYGYAFFSDQFVFENKLTAMQTIEPGITIDLVYGASLRYAWAKQLQDFAIEPFSRRDISQPVISANSIVLTGPQRAAFGDTRNFWAQGGESNAYTASIFLSGDAKITETFSIIAGIRGDVTKFDFSIPDEFERNANRGNTLVDTNKNYFTVNVNPILRVTENVSVYGAVQIGTALNPTQGGVIQGKGNFAEAELYEVGAKFKAFDGKLFSSVAAYYFDKSAFDEINQVDFPIRGEGFEFESTWQVNDIVTLVGNFTAQRVYRRSMPGFRFFATQEFFMPMVAGGLYALGGDADGLIARNNPDLVTPGNPEVVANLFAVVNLPSGFGFSFGPTFRDGYWHNFERTVRLPKTMIWNGNVYYRADRWELFLAVTNIFGEDYFYGSDPGFAANTIITKAPGAEANLTFTFKF